MLPNLALSMGCSRIGFSAPRTDFSGQTHLISETGFLLPKSCKKQGPTELRLTHHPPMGKVPVMPLCNLNVCQSKESESHDQESLQETKSPRQSQKHSPTDVGVDPIYAFLGGSSSPASTGGQHPPPRPHQGPHFVHLC